MVGIPQICERSDCFDPRTMQDGELTESVFSMVEHYAYHRHQNDNPSNGEAELDVGLVLQEQRNMVMEPWNNQRGSQTVQGLVQQSYEGTHVSSYNQSNWETDTSYNHHHEECFDRSLPETHYNPTSDALNMFPLPSCSPSTERLSLYTSLGLIGYIPEGDGVVAPAGVYYPLLPLNLPLQPPMLRDLFQSLPQGYYNTLGSCSNIDNDGDYHDSVGRPFTEGVFEFTSAYDIDGRKDTKKFASEKQRRVHLNDKFEALKNLVPNPTKADKASIVGDAIGYIKELKRTVNELKILVEKKRSSGERMKRHKTEDDSEIITLLKTEDFDSQASSGLRSSWLHRKSKNTEVDVRIIDDEVTVKLVQQKRVNCLLFVSKVFDEFHLDFNHVAGGLIGDYYSFLFNSKIHEGSTVYAHAIANKLIGAGDKQ